MGSIVDKEARQQLLRRWEAMRERVVSSLRSRGWSDDNAQDLFGEALLRAIDNSDQLDNIDAAESWFWQLAHRLAIDVARRRSSHPETKIEVDLDTLAAPAQEDPDICSCSLEILDGMPTGPQDILRAVDLNDIAVQDYARSIDITPNNASVRLYRARRALRKRMFETCQTTAVAECLDCGCGA